MAGADKLCFEGEVIWSALLYVDQDRLWAVSPPTRLWRWSLSGAEPPPRQDGAAPGPAARLRVATPPGRLYGCRRRRGTGRVGDDRLAAERHWTWRAAGAFGRRRTRKRGIGLERVWSAATRVTSRLTARRRRRRGGGATETTLYIVHCGT